MKFLKIFGWVFFPYIILPIQWKKLGTVGKGFGTAWAVVILLSLIGNAVAGPKQPVVAPQEQASNVTDSKSDNSATKETATTEQTSPTEQTSQASTSAQPVAAVAPAPKQQPIQQPATQPLQQPNPQPKAKTVQQPATQPKAQPVQQPKAKPVVEPTEVFYANCSEAKAAGAAPLREGDPGYRAKLDRDKDGVACE